MHGRRPLDEKENVSFVFTRSVLCATCKTIQHKRACYGGDIYLLFSNKFLYSINTKAIISPPARTYPKE